MIHLALVAFLAQSAALHRTATPIDSAPERVAYDATAAGELWARGATFKASFDASGATYVPFLGSAAPRNFPVSLHLASVSIGGAPVAFDAAAAPQRTGDRVDFDRGSLVERYVLARDAMEQLFVFESLPARGELVVQVGVESELAAVPSADSIRFSGAHGSVGYGRATVVDASGASAPAKTRLVDGNIEIRVGADFLAAARFPVTIDPVISTFPIDSSTFDDLHPDVAYDASTDHYLAVYDEAFSATDHDIRVRLLSSTGAVITSGYVDSGSGNWTSPHVANHGGSNQFLVVANDSTGTVRARTVAASTLAMSAQFSVGVGFSPDVGGTPSSGSTAYYLVAWTNTIEGIGSVVETRAVRTDTTLVGSAPLFVGFDNSSPPHVSKSNRGFDWNVVWSEAGDIWGSRIHLDGTVVTPEFPIDTSASADEAPSVSSCLDSSSRYLVVYARDAGVNRNITARLMDDATVIDTVDVSDLEGDSPVADQYDPAVDSDGVAFALVYTEFFGFPSADDGTYLATLTPIGNQLQLAEGHRMLSDSSSADETRARIAANRPSSGGAGEYIAVWEAAGGSTQHGDIEGGLFDAQSFTTFCYPGQDGVRVCPCSNPPSSVGRGCDNSAATGGAILSETGAASIANDSVVFHTTGERPTALSVVWQGNALVSAGAVFGQGVRCAGGALKRLYTKNASSGAVTAPSGNEPSVSARSAALADPLSAGSTRYHFVSYRDPTVLNGCPSGSTFNATQGGVLTWRP